MVNVAFKWVLCSPLAALMLISPDSQGEGVGQQLSPDKSSLLPRAVRAQPINSAMYRKLHGCAWGRGGDCFLKESGRWA